MCKTKMLFSTAMVACLLLASFAAYGAADNDEVYITGVTPVPGFFSVPFLTPWENALAVLPQTTTISLSNGSTASVTLSWATVVPYFPYAFGNYTVIGTFELPEGVSQPDPPIPLQVTTILRVEPGPGWFGNPITLDWEGFYQPGMYVEAKIWFEGAWQTYYYYVPSSYDGSKPVPLVVELHGGWCTGAALWVGTRTDRLAEKEGFIVVSPNWGAGMPPYIVNVTGYVAEIINAMEANFNIDPRRIYMWGPSGGGWLTGHFVLNYPGRIAGIGLVSGSISLLERVVTKGEKMRPMTVVMFAGTKESIGMPPLVGWNDLTVWNHAVAAKLIQNFHCDPTPQITDWGSSTNMSNLDLDELPYWTSVEDAILISQEFPTHVIQYTWTGGIYGSEVIVYDIIGGGHVWPGGTQYVSLEQVGAETYVIDATELLWKHLSKHALPEVFEGNVTIKTPSLTYEGPAELHISAYTPYEHTVYLHFDDQWIEWNINFKLKLCNVELYHCKGELGKLLVTVVRTKDKGSYAIAVGCKIFFYGSAS